MPGLVLTGVLFDERGAGVDGEFRIADFDGGAGLDLALLDAGLGALAGLDVGVLPGVPLRLARPNAVHCASIVSNVSISSCFTVSPNSMRVKAAILSWKLTGGII